jgi:hypothetical protein
MIRKLVIAVLCLAVPSFAQNISGHVKASQFNNWRVAGSANLAVGANPQVSISPCSVTGGGLNFNALTASTPIKIYDPNNPAIDEVLTPTSVVTGSTCTATFTTANAHTTPWNIGSGTGGLQEAINAAAQTGVMNVVELDSLWHQFNGTASTIHAAVGSPYLSLQDATVSPNATWRWNGTNYIPTYSLLGIALPTIAAGAAAGSSPTVSTSAGSSGNVMTANVTTGTATTTGTLFTETVGTVPASGNMNCTWQSIGANVSPAFTVSITGGVATIALSVAPAVSTAYIFAGDCN